jgi:threonine/homoserine/homoserine lactone efflux protein
MLSSFDLATLVAFFTTSFLLNITPGPAVLRTIGDSMQHGIGRAHGTIFGILGANAMYCALAVIGLGAVLLAVPEVFGIIKWGGIAYLSWIAFSALKAAWRGVDPAALPESAPAAWLFWRSFLLQSANPKASLFFCAMLPVFAGEAEGAPARIAILGALAILSEYPVLLAYAALGSRALGVARTPLAKRITNALSGFALLGAAAMVARMSVERR